MLRLLLFFLISLSWALLADAQSGVGALSTTRAVIVGISNYQDTDVPSLKYSHKDAEAFVSFLKGNAGGNIPDEQIKLLTNENATTGQIQEALYWLIDESKEGDKVLIYFSGHGDVETRTIRQRGYLLAHDTPANNYRLLAVSLEFLNDVIATLAQRNKSEVVIITDACRSGNLAGSSIKGAQATALELTNQFANEVKIMSCQPNEFSLEGKEWGGGRGLFSFHLIEGLVGLADQDDNAQVTLKEIGRYLEDHVSEQAAPAYQNPMTFGDKGKRLSFVDDVMLAQLKEEKLESRSEIGMSATSQRSLTSQLLAEADSTVAELYVAFEDAIADKYFLSSDLKGDRQPGQSASELFDRLVQESSLAPIQNSMKRNFAAALQDESQQSIISYLKADPEELEKRYGLSIDQYQNNPAYLAKAISLLGEDHFLYQNFKAKQYYFEGLLLRLKGKAEKHNKLLYDSAFAKIQLALEYEDEAAFIYYELGKIKEGLGAISDSEENRRAALSYFDSAAVKSPTWPLPYFGKCMNHRMLKEYDLADSMGRAALDLKPDFYNVYVHLAINYDRQDSLEQEIAMYKKALEINPSALDANANLGAIYLSDEQYDLARNYLITAIESDSTYFTAHYNLGFLYGKINKRDSSILYYEKAVLAAPNELDAHVTLVYKYMGGKEYQKAAQTLERLNKYFPDHPEYHFGLACWNALQGNIEPGLDALENAIQKGMTYDRIEFDSDLDSLRNTDRFKTIIKKHFPGKNK